MSFDRRDAPKYMRRYSRSIFLDDAHINTAADAAAYLALCDEKLAEYPTARDLEPRIGELEEAARTGDVKAVDTWRRAVAHGVLMAKAEESRRLRAEADAARKGAA